MYPAILAELGSVARGFGNAMRSNVSQREVMRCGRFGTRYSGKRARLLQKSKVVMRLDEMRVGEFPRPLTAGGCGY